MKLCPNDIFEGKLKTSLEYRLANFNKISLLRECILYKVLLDRCYKTAVILEN